MKTKKQSKTASGIRWTATKAASEFGHDPKTVSARIKTGGIVAGADKKFSTKQIVAAVFGDLEGERLREVHARADGLEIDNARKRGELLSVQETRQFWGRVLVRLNGQVKNDRRIPQELRDQIQQTISDAIEEEVWSSNHGSVSEEDETRHELERSKKK